MGGGHPVWAAAGVIALVVVVVAGVFILRLRHLAGRVGSFECALRRPGRGRWASGIATFGNESVEWMRLVSLSVRPRYRFERAGLELGEASPRCGRAHRRRRVRLSRRAFRSGHDGGLPFGIRRLVGVGTADSARPPVSGRGAAGRADGRCMRPGAAVRGGGGPTEQSVRRVRPFRAGARVRPFRAPARL